MEVRILRDGKDTGYKYLSCRLSATVDLVSQHCDLYLSRDSSFTVGQELGIEGDGVRLFSAPVVKVGPGRHNQLRIIAFAALDEVVHVNYHQEDAANILSDIIERHNYKSTGKRMDFALRGERMSLLHHWLDTVAPDKEAFMDAKGVLQVGLEPGSRVHLGKLIEEHGDWQEYRAVPVLLGQVSSQGIVRSLEYALKPTRERLRIWWGEVEGGAKEKAKDSSFGNSNDGHVSRKQCVMNGGGCNFEVASNPSADGSIPWNEYPVFSKVKQYSDYIESAAVEFNVDPQLIRAIMYIETTHGAYDYLVAPFDLNKSILPMNINTKYWGDFWGTRTQLKDPEFNIKAGAKMLAAIQANMPGAGIEKIATVYNNLNAVRVNDYGASVKRIYNTQPWVNPLWLNE